MREVSSKTERVAAMSRPGAPSQLLERSHELSTLADALAAVRQDGHGRLVFIGGEVGVGKTTLVRRFCSEYSESPRVLWGPCDALFSPRPLGPLVDIVESTPSGLKELVATGARPHEVAGALVRELHAEAPTILVLEDVHWADEATLDVLRLLYRRLDTVPALVLATYRDDELDRAHPLRIVLGELATERAVGRLRIEPLSWEAVAALAAPHGVDATELHRKTAGNPFFVTEVLAAGNEEMPLTIRDAVLARAARLTPEARVLLEAVAVVPPQVELWLLEVLAGEAFDRLEECLTSGMLIHVPEGVAFRHELARLAVERLISPNRARVLHRKTVDALEAASTVDRPDLARLAHHAEGAGDGKAVLRFAPRAAALAASVGAHREAAAQYARALRFSDDLSYEERADLLDRRSHECFLNDQYDEAIEAQQVALEYHRKLGDRRKEGDSLRSLSQTLWCPGRTAEAERAGRQAVTVLETIRPGRELAMAFNNLATLAMTSEKTEEALAWGTRALELARRLDDDEISLCAHKIMGTAEFDAGRTGAREKLEETRDRAERMGLEDEVADAFVCLTSAALRQRLHQLSDGYLEAGLRYCGERGLEVYRLYLLAFGARSELDQGRWSKAVDSAELVLRIPRTSTLPRIHALVTLGLVRARRGDPGPWAALDEALELATPTGELQQIAPVAAARAEAAWLEGREEVVPEATEEALDLARHRRASWVIGELAYWRWRAGILQEVPPDAAEPYVLQIAGDWARAAELWTQIGSPYEAALALAEADEEEPLRRALDQLHRLGAQQAAASVARRLRRRGVRGLPRGPRAATRQNPANLTKREVEVLTLVTQGLRNAEIGKRLFLSEKTVDHHVSAILRKLAVRTRGQAAAEAARIGLTALDQ